MWGPCLVLPAATWRKGQTQESVWVGGRGGEEVHPQGILACDGLESSKPTSPLEVGKPRTSPPKPTDLQNSSSRPQDAGLERMRGEA